WIQIEDWKGGLTANFALIFADGAWCQGGDMPLLQGLGKVWGGGALLHTWPSNWTLGEPGNGGDFRVEISEWVQTVSFALVHAETAVEGAVDCYRHGGRFGETHELLSPLQGNGAYIRPSFR